MQTLEAPEIQKIVREVTEQVGSRFYVRHCDRDDVYQDVCLILIQYKSIERYDKSTGTPFRAYIARIVHNYLCRRYKHITKENSLFVSLDIENDNNNFLHTILTDTRQTFAEEGQLESDIKVIILKLAKEYPHSTSVVYSGKEFVTKCIKEAESYYRERGYQVYPRSAALVFYLLYKGYNQVDIASFLHTAKKWSCDKVKIIRESEVIKEWAGFRGSVKQRNIEVETKS